jgi:hypothetical protein
MSIFIFQKEDWPYFVWAGSDLSVKLNKRGYADIPAESYNRATPPPRRALRLRRWGEEIARKCSYETLARYTLQARPREGGRLGEATLPSSLNRYRCLQRPEIGSFKQIPGPQVLQVKPLQRPIISGAEPRLCRLI